MRERKVIEEAVSSATVDEDVATRQLVALALILETNMDIRELLEKSEERMVRMEANIAQGLNRGTE